ncbi:uncharacterized protein A4U43_C04F21560 [Asparagus officinalis]|uniref:Uncharacterized protein n=1 Tax=Asparagus officinalis TaxID=4686 RepID=A0A5P1F2Q2_ASPOF|nr:uncharacterized protein LOC109837726 [Asparagus officinalis]ONK72646.1 uncharacterized protein A4U43_C04F21560 [Asparagus officinalis]
MDINKNALGDESFKRPGSVPFKWEIEPGIPKLFYNAAQQKTLPQLSPPPCVRKQSPLALPRQAPPVSQGCFPKQSLKRREVKEVSSSSPHRRVMMQSSKSKEVKEVSSMSPRKTTSARYSSPFSLSFRKSQAKEVEVIAQCLF